MCGMSTDLIYRIVQPNEETITGWAMRLEKRLEDYLKPDDTKVIQL